MCLTNHANPDITEEHVFSCTCGIGAIRPQKNSFFGRGFKEMNKTEFITALAEKTGMKKTEAEKAVKGFTELIAGTLRDGEKVSLVGFGTLEVLEREAREGRNPRTGKTMTIPASKAPKFKAGRGLKEAVNEK